MRTPISTRDDVENRHAAGANVLARPEDSEPISMVILHCSETSTRKV